MNRQHARIGLLVLSILFLNVSSTLAETIGFDDLYWAVDHLAPVPFGYAGFSWTSFRSMHVPTEYPAGGATGYVAGMASPYFVVYNYNAGPAEFSSDKPFTFVGAYLTAAWLEDLEITVEGFPDPTGINKQTVKVSPSARQWFTFDYKGVNRVKFTPSGGTLPSGYSGGGTFFVMDDLQIAADDAPESTSITIDIKPGGSPNVINPKSKGVTRVAILTKGSFDATKVDHLMVCFGPGNAQSLKATIEDVNGDEQLDMLLFFRTDWTGIECGDTSATLKVMTPAGGVLLEGTDSIITVPPCK